MNNGSIYMIDNISDAKVSVTNLPNKAHRGQIGRRDNLESILIIQNRDQNRS